MLLSFYKQFVPKVLDGSKGFTIRNTPKRMPKEGERLHMYTGGYNDTRTLITRDFTLRKPRRITIMITEVSNRPTWNIRINVSGYLIEDIYSFAVMDGFDSVEHFVKHWTKNYKYKNVKMSGYLLPWQSIDHLLISKSC